MQKFLFMCFFLLPLNLAAQRLIDNPVLVQKVQKAVDYIYGFQFEKSKEAIKELEPLMGQHPGFSLLEALRIYWQYYPLQQDTKTHNQYEQLMLLTADRAGELLRKNKDDVEGVFFSLAAYGYLTSYYADKGNLLKTINYAKKSYNFLIKGMELKNEYVEFFFSSGLYNYYREKYPENHPVYKPFLWFFQSGDKEQGIIQLNKAADQAVFTSTEALNYLYHILLHYESDPELSFKYAQRMHEKYPQNDVFLIFYIENMLALNKVTNVIPLIDKIKRQENFYQLARNLFKGNVAEKFYKKHDEALQKYTLAVKYSLNANTDVDHYIALTYAGMARCYHALGMPEKARESYEKCLDYADYDIVLNEAKAYLDK